MQPAPGPVPRRRGTPGAHPQRQLRSPKRGRGAGGLPRPPPPPGRGEAEKPFPAAEPRRSPAGGARSRRPAIRSRRRRSRLPTRLCGSRASHPRRRPAPPPPRAPHRPGSRPAFPPGSQPDPALQVAPQPGAPTLLYPSGRAPGASMFPGDRERGGCGCGCGRPAGSRLCSPAGGAYGAPGRRPQPHRHAAPHLARLRTRLKGAGGARNRGARPPPPPRRPPG